MMQIFDKMDDGRTIELQVASKHAMDDIVRTACGKTNVGNGDWYVQCQRTVFRSGDTARNCTM